MAEQQHPITPPPELVQQWRNEEPYEGLLSRAAQWGADQELEACCEWLPDVGEMRAMLRAARRPKPPSLKEQALETLKYPKDLWSEAEVDTIRRALEAQPEPEGPTDEELLQIAASSIAPYESCGIHIGEYEAETERAVEVYGSELITFARAVLARWGRPAIEPPSLKEQALAVIENSEICDHLSPEHAAILRRALEQLDD